MGELAAAVEAVAGFEAANSGVFDSIHQFGQFPESEPGEWFGEVEGFAPWREFSGFITGRLYMAWVR